MKFLAKISLQNFPSGPDPRAAGEAADSRRRRGASASGQDRPRPFAPGRLTSTPPVAAGMKRSLAPGSERVRLPEEATRPGRPGGRAGRTLLCRARAAADISHKGRLKHTSNGRLSASTACEKNRMTTPVLPHPAAARYTTSAATSRCARFRSHNLVFSRLSVRSCVSIYK